MEEIGFCRDMSWIYNPMEDVYASQMEGADGIPRLLSVEEKWQIIFNKKTRAPIYAVTQYIGYLRQFVSGQDGKSKKSSDIIKKDGIHPISYLLRKLKLDLKMSYDSFVEEFLKSDNNGMSLLVKLLKSIQNAESQQSGSTNMTQLKNYKKTLTDEHDCLLCIKYSLRVKKGLQNLFDMNYGLETVSMCVISTFTKSRGTAIEILTLALSTDEGFSRILDCFTYIQLKIGEPVRFKSLINMLNLDTHQNIIFKVSTMKFINCLLDASPNLNIRVYLQHEIKTAGLDVAYVQEKASGTGLEFDDLRRELEMWNRRYVDVDTLITNQTSSSRHVTQNAENKAIEELQTRVKKLSADRAYLEYHLKSMSEELKKRYEEIQSRNSSTVDKSTQCHKSTSVKDVGCQCELLSTDTNIVDDPLQVAAQYFGWKDGLASRQITGPNGENFFPVYECSSSNMDDDESKISRDIATSDEDGVVKVKYWLRSNYGSSESDLESNKDGGQTFYFARNSMSRRRVSGRTKFPGNWKLIPKSIEQFPSRFPPHQCHQTFCDRCDVRNRPENSDHIRTNNVVVQSVAVDYHDNGNVDGDMEGVKQTDVKSSQSSDSAIGGSGDRLWNDRRRIPLLPKVETSEADILQDLIQPEDSASRCPDPEVEPFPDYSTISTRHNTQKSYKSELAKVLKEFEGELLDFDRPVHSSAESVEHYITLGEV
ncbi:hypothetical protein ACF0H5_000232 [Mactra antiquata]